MQGTLKNQKNNSW